MAITYYKKWASSILSKDIFNFYRLILVAIITMGLGLILLKIKFFYDKVVKVFSTVLYVIGSVICISLILAKPLLGYNFLNFVDNNFLEYLSLTILIAYNIIVIFSIRDLIIRFVKYYHHSSEIYPLLLNIFLMGNITIFLIRQLNLEHISIIISFAYLFLAIASIIYGFIRRYIYIRFFGLGLIVFSLLILFINIFHLANIPGRIITFFGFGMLLLLISFIYQSVSKKMEDYSAAKLHEKTRK